ncbi:MAG: squalene/phytoene synthase family protein [Magnetospirillum sp. WYHS-4]
MASLSPCGALARRLDNDRFLCALAAPAVEREGLFALLALGAELFQIRHRAREPLLRQIRLQWWRDSVESVFAGHPPRQPTAEALAETIARHGLERSLFDRLLDGHQADLADGPPDDSEGLAQATAGTLTLLALQVLGVRDGPVAEAGHRVGIAWGLVDLARRGRIPWETTLALGHLAEARRLAPRPPKAALPALLPATLAETYLARPDRTQRGTLGLIRLFARGLRGRY